MTFDKLAPQAEDQESILLEIIDRKGGRTGNITLLNECKTLGWQDNEYWAVRDKLVNKGQLVLGRGKGGSVRRPETETTVLEPVISETLCPSPQNELFYYAPIARLIQSHWVKDKRLDPAIVEVTAQQGRRPTGGVWTRPDITVLSYSTLLYVPRKQFELITFEIKPWATLDIRGVYESLSHNKASTRSYLIAITSDEDTARDDISEFLKPIDDTAKKYGIGFITVSKLTDYGSWDERVSASYSEPEPQQMHDFISQQLSEKNKETLLTWFR